MTVVITGLTGACTHWHNAPNVLRKMRRLSLVRANAAASANSNHAPRGRDGAITSGNALDFLNALASHY